MSLILAESPPSNIVSSKDQTVVAPYKLTLNCSANGEPQPKISWTRISDSTLVMMPLNIVDEKNAGGYRCTADNGVGSPSTTDVFINVMGE